MKDYHAFWIFMGVLAVLALLNQTAWGVTLFMLLAAVFSAGVAGYSARRHQKGVTLNAAWAVLMLVAAFTAPSETAVWLMVFTGVVSGGTILYQTVV